MWAFLVVFVVAVDLGASTPNIQPVEMEPPGKDFNVTELELSLKANAEARVGHPYPSSASCDIDWTFGMDCVEASMVLVKQIQKWSGADNCENLKHDPSYDHCMYQLFHSDQAEYIWGMHMSPDGTDLDVFYIFFDRASWGCRAWSYSYSTDWHNEILDDGRNYCNIWSLVDGTDLSTLPHYSRDTSDYRCTQFTSSSDCSN